jgi:hypothetical protein
VTCNWVFGKCNTKTGACDCENDYYGRLCQRFCDSVITCNNHGTCDDNGDCRCYSGYSGSFCNMESPNTAPSSSSSTPTSVPRSDSTVAVTVLVILAVLILIVVLAFYYRANKNTQGQQFEVIN